MLWELLQSLHIESANVHLKIMKRVRELINMGCYTQVNSSHVLKSKLFLENYNFIIKKELSFFWSDFFHIIACVICNVDSRPLHMAQTYVTLSQKYGEAKAQELFI